MWLTRGAMATLEGDSLREEVLGFGGANFREVDRVCEEDPSSLERFIFDANRPQLPGIAPLGSRPFKQTPCLNGLSN